MCPEQVPVAPTVGAVLPCLCLVPCWHRVRCDACVVFQLDACTAAWLGGCCLRLVQRCWPGVSCACAFGVLKETRYFGRHKQAGTRAGNYQRHTFTINVSPPTQANNATRATNGNPPDQAAVRASNQYTTLTSHSPVVNRRNLSHQGIITVQLADHH